MQSVGSLQPGFLRQSLHLQWERRSVRGIAPVPKVHNYLGLTSKVKVVKSLSQSRSIRCDFRRSVPRRSHRPLRLRSKATRPSASVFRIEPRWFPAATMPSGNPAADSPFLRTRTANRSPARSTVGSTSGTISSRMPTGSAHCAVDTAPESRTKVLACFAYCSLQRFGVLALVHSRRISAGASISARYSFTCVALSSRALGLRTTQQVEMPFPDAAAFNRSAFGAR